MYLVFRYPIIKMADAAADEDEEEAAVAWMSSGRSAETLGDKAEGLTSEGPRKGRNACASPRIGSWKRENIWTLPSMTMWIFSKNHGRQTRLDPDRDVDIIN